MVSSPITNGVMCGIPKTHPSWASGMNSSSRQLGQSLGVAIVGWVLAASIRGSDVGRLPGGHPRRLVRSLAGCGYVVLLLGVLCTTQWAEATASRLG